MNPASDLTPLAQQLQLWLRLAAAIEQSQSFLLRGDLTEFERATEAQAECCRQYRALQSQDVPQDSEPDPALRVRIELARAKVRHLNRTHAELLRRASRSVRILRNLMSSVQGVYNAPPALHQLPALPEGK